MALCAPGAVTAWRYRQMPHFGSFVDDGIYWVSAKALAGGEGYRIVSLPERPWQTKYPPLYPAYMSLVWKLNPRFPENLSLAALFAWLWAPPMLLLSFLTLRKLGLAAPAAFVLTALLAVNPHFLSFSSGIHTEVPYTVLLLGALLLLERASRTSGLGWPVAAGLVAGAAFLCRTNGIALVASGAAGLLLARRARSALAFAATALPAIASWSWWTWTHKYTGSNPAVIYHTDYVRFYLETVRISDLPVLLWGNLGGILIRGGKLIIPTPGESPPERLFCVIVMVLALAGVWRLGRRLGATHYHLYAAGHLLLLIPWNFPANGRLLFPLAPLLLAGLFEELRHVAGMARAAMMTSHRSQQAAGAAMLVCLAALGIAGAWSWSRPLGEHWLQLSETYRQRRARVARAYQWIKESTPPDASFIAWQDALLYLETGRHASSPGISPVPWYVLSPVDVVRDYVRGLPAVAARQQREYLLLVDTEFLLPDPDSLGYARHLLARDPRLREVWISADAVIYEVLRADYAGASSAGRPSLTNP